MNLWSCGCTMGKRTVTIYLTRHCIQLSLGTTVHSCQKVHSHINVIINIALFVHTGPVENLDEA